MAGSKLWHKGSERLACLRISWVFLLCSALFSSFQFFALFLRSYFICLALFGSHILEVSLRVFCNIIRCGNFPCRFFFFTTLAFLLAMLYMYVFALRHGVYAFQALQCKRSVQILLITNATHKNLTLNI